MSNVLAIAQKELKSYFASPIAYIVIGLWALLYGYFFAAILHFFVQQSMQMNQFGMQGPQSMNVNQQLIRPLLQNVLILILFLMPMVTMRAYSEEKRSGTIELLLTSPLTDFQIILGKFFGAMALYGVMLAVTLIHLALLFVYGHPEWKPILTAYIGLLLMGGCFISLGLFISSLTKNQIVAGMVTSPSSCCCGSSPGSAAPRGRRPKRSRSTCRSSTTTTTSAKACSTPRTSSTT